MFCLFILTTLLLIFKLSVSYSSISPYVSYNSVGSGFCSWSIWSSPFEEFLRESTATPNCSIFLVVCWMNLSLSTSKEIVPELTFRETASFLSPYILDLRPNDCWDLMSIGMLSEGGASSGYSSNSSSFKASSLGIIFCWDSFWTGFSYSSIICD